MNTHRPEPIRLRYFQHLAVLFTEIVLDRILNHRASFLAELNRFVDQRNAALPPGDDPYPHFAEADLDKLAYWMATGSGKTLIMHFNYRQFLHYHRRPLDNILLITPNEGMTEQHLEEMRLSGIPCERFQNAESGLGLGGRDVVRVIEIHKLVEEKKGGGVSVPVEAFEGNNLIFVDEGHKGSGGEAWRRYRDALGQTGFTFEYSATFGQALTAARNDALTVEYGKAIVFDYSYKYFYEDGYGKDFRVLNLREDTSEEMTDTLLLANLLSFYQQQRAFGDDGAAASAYNLEAPLWIFVGSSVNAVYREAGARRPDQRLLPIGCLSQVSSTGTPRPPRVWCRLPPVLSPPYRGASFPKRHSQAAFAHRWRSGIAGNVAASVPVHHGVEWRRYGRLRAEATGRVADQALGAAGEPDQTWAAPEGELTIECEQFLGGLLNSYYRKAA